MRTFITIDSNGNVKTFVKTKGVPGANEGVPADHIEVTDLEDRDWLLFKRVGSEYVKRTDLIEEGGNE